MPALSTKDAAEKLAKVVEKATPNDLVEFNDELFPEGTARKRLGAGEMAQLVRHGLEAEELVDLWNVVFPKDHHVWHNEETQEIHYNEEMADYAD